MNSRESGISIRFPSRAVIHYLEIAGSTTAQGSASRGTHEINNDGPGAIKTVEKYNCGGGRGYFYNVELRIIQETCICMVSGMVMNGSQSNLHNSKGLLESRPRQVTARNHGHHLVHHLSEFGRIPTIDR